MQQNKKGYSMIFVILILVALMVLVSGASYYLLQSTGQAPALPVYNGGSTVTETTIETPITDDDDLDTIEAELDATIIGDPDSELDEMESDASSL